MQSNENSSWTGHGLLSQDVGNEQKHATTRYTRLNDSWNITSADISPRDPDFLSSSQSSTGCNEYSMSTLVTHDMYPEWKQQVLQRKEEKKRREVQRIREEVKKEKERIRVEEERRNSIPLWKRELLEKKQWRDFDKATDDEITSRRDTIAAIESEIVHPATPTWQCELLNKKKEKLEFEMQMIQLKRDEEIEKIKQNMMPVHWQLLNTTNHNNKINIFE